MMDDKTASEWCKVLHQLAQDNMIGYGKAKLLIRKIVDQHFYYDLHQVPGEVPERIQATTLEYGQSVPAWQGDADETLSEVKPTDGLTGSTGL